MAEKIAFEVGYPTLKIKKIWEKKTGILNNFYWPPSVFLTHLHNYHDYLRILSDPFHSPFIF